MFNWTAYHMQGAGKNRQPMEETTVQAGTFQQAMKTALAHWAGEQAKNIKVYPCIADNDGQDASCYMAVQIAKTTARFINGKAPNKTQQTIIDELDRLTGKYNHEQTAQESPLACTLFFTGAGNFLTETIIDEFGQETDVIVAPAQIGQNTQDFVSWALLGVRAGFAQGLSVWECANMGFAYLNAYIDEQRTARVHEVLTAFDIETDTDGTEKYIPVNTQIRRIVKGLTDREKGQGLSIRNNALAHAMDSVALTLSPRQRDVWELLAKGKPIGEKRTGGNIAQHRGIYSVCKALHIDKKTVKEHIKAIEKKCLSNETVCMTAYMKGYRLDSTGRTAPVPHAQEKPCIIPHAVGFVDSRTAPVYGYTLSCADSMFFYSPHAYHENRQAMYNRLFNAEGTAPVMVEQDSPCPLSPVPYRVYMEHISVKYLLQPHDEYRQERQAMYNRLFAVHVIQPLSHDEYRQERQAMYNRLFNAQGDSRTETAPIAQPLSLPKYGYHTYRQSLYNALFGAIPYKAPTAWTAGKPIMDYKWTGKK